MKPARWLAVAALAACGAAQGGGLVDGRIELPKQLREVSGCVAVDDRTLVCVQDEKGELWFVDLRGERKVRSEAFGPAGDYEGLARAGASWWALRSDGVLLQLAPHEGAHRIAREVKLPGGHPDWEALCFDADGQRLLAMPKAVAGDDKEARDRRPVFAIDPATGEVGKAPALTLSRRALQAALAKLGAPLPTKTTDKGKAKVDFELAVSEIAVVPGKRELLVLAGGDRLLLRVDFTGQLLGARALDAKDLPQAEGLAFLADGRLLVASEGDGKKARALVVPMP